MAALPADLRRTVLTWMYKLFTHDQNETQTILRAATAMGYGLDPAKFATVFPGETTVVVQPPADPPVAQPAVQAPVAQAAGPQPGGSTAKRVLAAGLLTAAGAAAGWGMGYLAPAKPAPQQAPPPTWNLTLPDAEKPK